MMSVPPSGGGGPSRSPGSRDSNGVRGKPNKEFKLPDRTKGKDKEPKKQKELKQKKESNQGQDVANAGQKGVGAGGDGSVVTPAGQVAPSAQAKAISKAILDSVAKMLTGEIGGKQTTALELSAHPNLPPAFVGANLTLTQTDAGLHVAFTNLASETEAIALMQQNQEQLASLARTLASKNITLAQLQVGNTNITLPRVEPTAPVQPPPAAHETPQERQRGDQGGGGGGQGEPETEE